MKTNKLYHNITNDYKIKRSATITIIGDAVLLIVLVVCLLSYFSSNSTDIYNHNIETIESISASKSELMLAALENTSHEVKSSYQYCNNKSVTEILDYLSIICDQENEYQLLKRDESASTDLYHVYHGYSTKKIDGAYQQIEYKNTDLAISIYLHASKDSGVISYSQSFTNKTDAMRYFAAFCGINTIENGELTHYFLIKPQKESRVLAQLQTYSQYSELATAICYADGKYLARDTDFGSDNFYDYIYEYNNLSIDERDAVRTDVQNNPERTGFLTYQDNKGRDCVFAYTSCGEDKDWYVLVSVPQSEFIAVELLSFFPLMIIIFLVALLAFNTWRLLGIVNALRSSVAREKIANSSKSSFLSRMSHEIRTPLNAIIGYNAIARGDITGAKNEAERRQAEMSVMDCLAKSEIASKHLLTIINDVLDMSAIENGKISVVKERFDFRGLITSLTTVFYSQARAKGVEFEVIFDSFTEEWFIGDQLRTSQILTNLLSNAIKFTPEGGSVKLLITQPDAKAKASHIHFEIADTGIGMTEEHLERIWKPFEQADSSITRRFGGTGLGLSITKNLVDLMDGSISVESIPGTGTKFYVDLVYDSTEQPPGNLNDFSMINALVVDDDESTCNYVRLLFSRCGARCATVTSGEDAVKAVSVAAKQNDDFTLCLVDWKMPGMDGIETIQKIREIVGNRFPVVVLTAYDYTELADKLTSTAAVRFIAKPLFQSSLFDLLANIGGTQPVKLEDNNNSVDFTGFSVIVAEDNKMNMEITKRLLQSTGLTVYQAWNGREAVELFEVSAPGTYAAILMDVHMPVMNGHEATRTIRASSHTDAKTIPIIAITADAFNENVAEAHVSGMNDHISKPIDPIIVYEMLRKYINK